MAQHVLGVIPDGVIGPQTRNAVALFFVRSDVAPRLVAAGLAEPADTLDAAYFGVINAIGREDAQKLPPQPGEAWLQGSDDLGDIQEELGVARSGQLDPATRRAIWDFEYRAGDLRIDGILDQATAAAIAAGG
jgi:peptidoglycan hydrolase-like protein with peptidoglycan-binding domain